MTDSTPATAADSLPGPSCTRPRQGQTATAALDAVVPPIPAPTLPLGVKHVQTILAEPELHAQGVYGNCLQAAIATLLNVHLDAVPHFAQFAWWEGAFTLWLRGHGLDATWVTVEQIPASGPTLLLGKSPRGWGHVCVGDGPEVIWDTHPSHVGLSSVEGAVIVHPWTHGDPRCFLCKSIPNRPVEEAQSA